MELSYVAYLDDDKAKEKLETPFTFEAQVTWESVDPDEVVPGVCSKTLSLSVQLLSYLKTRSK